MHVMELKTKRIVSAAICMADLPVERSAAIV